MNTTKHAMQPWHLSLWEIAQRWHGYNPQSGDNDPPPVEVQDTLRFLAQRALYHECGVCTPRGIELKTNRLIVPREKYIFAEDEDELPDYEKDEIYTEYCERHGARHDELVAQLRDCVEKAIFDKDYLQSVHLTKAWLYIICREHDVPLPDFWISESETDELNSSWTANLIGGLGLSEDDAVMLSAGTTETETVNQEQVDSMWSQLKGPQKTRLLCREIAIQLWNKDPSLTIESICKNELIQAAGAKHYKGRDTVRNWIKDLDPRPEDKKRGRPPQEK